MPEFRNIPLLQNEEVLFAGDFTQSPILRQMKAGLVITRQRVAVIHPQHVFWFFRVGQTMSSSPVGAICEVTVGRLLSRHHLRMAMICGFIALFLLLMAGSAGAAGASFVGALTVPLMLVLFGVAAFQLWLARRLGLTISHVGGGHLSVGVDSAELQGMLQAAQLVEQLMVNTDTAASAKSTAMWPNSHRTTSSMPPESQATLQRRI